MRNKLIFTLVCVVMLLLLAGCNKIEQPREESGANQPIPDIVAEYTGGTVKKQDFEKYLDVQRFRDKNFDEALKQKDFLLNQLYTYIYQKMATANLAKPKTADDEFIKGLMSQMEKQMNEEYGEQGFEKRLQQYKLVKSDVVNQFIEYDNMVEFVNGKITDDDRKAEYDIKLKAGEVKKTIATVSHILIMADETKKDGRSKADALKRANEVLAELKAGGDFAKLAKKYSDDPGSKDNGGTYADADVDNWVPEFKQAAIDLPLNTLSEPVETQYGYHIMKVTKRSEIDRTYEEAKPKLEQAVWEKKFNLVFRQEILPSITKVNIK